MAQEDFLNAFFEREIETIEILLSQKSLKSAVDIEAFIKASLAQGVSMDAIKQSLIDDLKNKGPIFGGLRRSLRSTVNGTINRVRDGGYFSEIGVEQTFRWAAVLVNTCPDCEKRHGQAATWEQWELQGLPRAGQTVCQENCRCMLVPDQFVDMEPVRVDARR